MTFDEAIRRYVSTNRICGCRDADVAMLGLDGGDAETTVNAVVAIRIPAVGELSRRERDELRVMYRQITDQLHQGAG